jgi:predicted nucleic acid-binding protein
MKYLLDTNIFNRLLDGNISVQNLPSGMFVATHIQMDEISRTQNAKRKEQLLAKFREFIPTLTPTASFLWDESRFDQARWSDGKLFEALSADLLHGQKKDNATRDALIAEVAIVDGVTLLTADSTLAKVARRHGANVIEFQ